VHVIHQSHPRIPDARPSSTHRRRDLFRAGADLGETLRFDRSMLHVAGEGRCRSLFSHAGIRAHHLAAHRDTVEGVNGALRAASAGDGGDAKFRRHAWRHLFGRVHVYVYTGPHTTAHALCAPFP
jgi:hypothetical protein